MKFQLVIQFPEELYGDIELIADIEDKLDESLVDAEVDGHDIGSGEVNIFIHTNDPNNTFKIVKNILVNDLTYAKIAYREIGTESYITLWPKDLLDFHVT